MLRIGWSKSSLDNWSWTSIKSCRSRISKVKIDWAKNRMYLQWVGKSRTSAFNSVLKLIRYRAFRRKTVWNTLRQLKGLDLQMSTLKAITTSKYKMTWKLIKPIGGLRIIRSSIEESLQMKSMKKNVILNIEILNLKWIIKSLKNCIQNIQKLSKFSNMSKKFRIVLLEQSINKNKIINLSHFKHKINKMKIYFKINHQD